MMPIIPFRAENPLALFNLLTPAKEHVVDTFPEPIKAEIQEDAPIVNQLEELDSSSSSSDSETSSESSGSHESSSEGGETEKEHGEEHEDGEGSQSNTQDTQIIKIDGESDTKEVDEALPSKSTTVKQVASFESTTPQRKRRSFPRKGASQMAPSKPSKLSRTFVAGDGGDEDDQGENEDQKRRRKQQEHGSHRSLKSKEKPAQAKSQ